MGRLASVNCGGEWSQTFTPDNFGNQSTAAGGSSPLVASFNGSNQFSSVSGFVPNYNADGDLLDDPTGGGVRNAYAWDAEGKLVGLNGTTQVFDALGRLVQNSAGGEALYTPAGQQFGSMAGQAVNWEVFPVPGGGAAVYNSAGLNYYAHADWQGSWRLASTPARGFDGDEAYSPYGVHYAGGGPQVFTGKFLYLAGPYQFPFRAESPALKRWLSPDPAALAAVNPADPQSWNQYAYVDNQPLSTVDPSGLCGVIFGGITESPTSVGGQAVLSYARSIGADVAFGLPDSGPLGEVSDVGSILFGSAGASVGVEALNDAASQPGPLDVITFSGGAQTFLNSLSADPALASGINSVTYYSPGTSTASLFSPGQGAAAIVFGTGVADGLATLGSDWSALPAAQTGCGHNFPCEVGAVAPLGTGGSCKNPKVFTPNGVTPLGGGSGGGSGSGGFVGGDPGAFLLSYVDWLMGQPIGFATHKISFSKCDVAPCK